MLAPQGCKSSFWLFKKNTSGDSLRAKARPQRWASCLAPTQQGCLRVDQYPHPKWGLRLHLHRQRHPMVMLRPHTAQWNDGSWDLLCLNNYKTETNQKTKKKPVLPSKVMWGQLRKCYFETALERDRGLKICSKTTVSNDFSLMYLLLGSEKPGKQNITLTNTFK